MTFKCSFKKMRTSAAIRSYAKEKSEKFKKYFAGRINVDWNFGMERELRHAHLHITGNHIDFFAEAETDDIYASIEQVLDKVERQIRKHKEVVKDNLHRQGRHLKAS